MDNKILNVGILYRETLRSTFDIDYIKSQLKNIPNINPIYIDLCKVDLISLPTNLDSIFLKPGELDYVEEIIKINPNIKWIHSMFSGVDKFLDKPIIKNNDSILLSNARGAFADSLAEFAILAMLYYYYNTNKYIEAFNQRKWIRPLNHQLKGKTLTILGYGMNGKVLAQKAKYGLSMNVIGVRQTIIKDEYLDNIVHINELDSVLPETDFLVNFLPHTDKTINIINYSRLSLMKSTSVFINLGRGSAVVETDLIKILKEKKILGAVLDVTKDEPLDINSEYYNLDNIYLSCHSCDHTSEVFKLAVDSFIKNLINYMNTGELINVVDKLKGY